MKRKSARVLFVRSAVQRIIIGTRLTILTIVANVDTVPLCGTVMECSYLPFHYWLYTMFLMTMTKKSIAALEVQRQLGHKRYEPIWSMMHKIRIVMGSRDDTYELDGVVELDDAFFKTHSDNKKKINPNGAEAASNKARSWLWQK